MCSQGPSQKHTVAWWKNCSVWGSLWMRKLLYFKDFITFDFESLLKPCPLVDDGEGRKTKVLDKHLLVSVGLCASQDDIDPMYLAHEDPHILTRQFLICLLLLRRRMVRRLFGQYKEVFDQLVEKIICHRLILMYETLGCNMELVPEEDREEVETVVDNLGRYKVSVEVWIDNLVKVKTQLEQYIRSMVCLGFNSAKYDMKIIAPYMIPLMLGECREFMEQCHRCLYSPP